MVATVWPAKAAWPSSSPRIFYGLEQGGSSSRRPWACNDAAKMPTALGQDIMTAFVPTQQAHALGQIQLSPRVGRPQTDAPRSARREARCDRLSASVVQKTTSSGRVASRVDWCFSSGNARVTMMARVGAVVTVKPAGQLGIVGPKCRSTDHDRPAPSTQSVHLGSRRSLTGNPGGMPGPGGDSAVQGGGQLDDGKVLVSASCQTRKSVMRSAQAWGRIPVRTVIPWLSRNVAAAGHVPVRIQAADDHGRDPGIQNGLGAGRVFP